MAYINPPPYSTYFPSEQGQSSSPARGRADLALVAICLLSSLFRHQCIWHVGRGQIMKGEIRRNNYIMLLSFNGNIISYSLQSVHIIHGIGLNVVETFWHEVVDSEKSSGGCSVCDLFIRDSSSTSFESESTNRVCHNIYHNNNTSNCFASSV